MIILDFYIPKTSKIQTLLPVFQRVFGFCSIRSDFGSHTVFRYNQARHDAVTGQMFNIKTKSVEIMIRRYIVPECSHRSSVCHHVLTSFHLNSSLDHMWDIMHRFLIQRQYTCSSDSNFTKSYIVFHWLTTWAQKYYDILVYISIKDTVYHYNVIHIFHMIWYKEPANQMLLSSWGKKPESHMRISSI